MLNVFTCSLQSFFSVFFNHFLPSSSTEALLLRITSELLLSKSTEPFPVLLSLDLSAVFDSVDHLASELTYCLSLLPTFLLDFFLVCWLLLLIPDF